MISLAFTGISLAVLAISSRVSLPDLGDKRTPATAPTANPKVAPMALFFNAFSSCLLLTAFFPFSIRFIIDISYTSVIFLYNMISVL